MVLGRADDTLGRAGDVTARKVSQPRGESPRKVHLWGLLRIGERRDQSSPR